MREEFPKMRFPRGGFRHCCSSCGRGYVWSRQHGNHTCPFCYRKVPVSERPLLPAEEMAARALVAREAGGEER